MMAINTEKAENIIRSMLVMATCLMLFLAVISPAAKVVHAASSKFTVDAKTDIGSVKDPVKLKLLASANGETKVKKTGVISVPNSGTISVPFDFNKKNDIVTAGYHDEYFVCGYILDAKTGDTISYQCNEGDLLNEDGHNEAILDSFITVPKSQNSDAKDVKINILVPLSDRPNAHKIKVLVAIRGEFQAKVIDVAKANGKNLNVVFTFDRNTDIGKIQLGDLYSTCVSANELNPPEGTECEKRHIKSFDKPNELPAR